MKFKFYLVDLFRHTNVKRDYDFLMESQYWSHKNILEYQLKKLKLLVHHAYNNTRYYKSVFDSIRLKPEDIRSLEDMNYIPILTKQVVKENGSDLLAQNNSYGKWPKSTGGSTGSPLRYYLSSDTLSMDTANRFRAWSEAGYKLGDKIIYLGGPSLIGKKDYKRNIYYKLYNFKPISSFEMNETNLAHYIKLIKSSSAKIMFAYASSAKLLADYVLANRISDIGLKAIFTTAEVLFPAHKEKIKEAFRCEVFNFYGANDGGIAAFECSEHNGLHQVSERAILEIIDENNHHVAVGEEGNIITTDLTNYTMPFIRYKVEDRASMFMDSCKCGRNLPLISEIKGRISDFIIGLHGEKVHGEFFSHLFSQYNWIEEFQIVQRNLQEIKIILKTNRTEHHSDNLLIQSILKHKFKSMQVNLNYVQNIEKTAGGKYKFIISEIGNS